MGLSLNLSPSKLSCQFGSAASAVRPLRYIYSYLYISFTIRLLIMCAATGRLKPRNTIRIVVGLAWLRRRAEDRNCRNIIYDIADIGLNTQTGRARRITSRSEGAHVRACTHREHMAISFILKPSRDTHTTSEVASTYSRNEGNSTVHCDDFVFLRI